MLEMSLDENIAALAEARSTPQIIRILTVPAGFAHQADDAITRFVNYRTTYATNYPGIPLLPEGKTFEGAKDVNNSRALINRLVSQVMKDNPTTGRTVPPSAGASDGQ